MRSKTKRKITKVSVDSQDIRLLIISIVTRPLMLWWHKSIAFFKRRNPQAFSLGTNIDIHRVSTEQNTTKTLREIFKYNPIRKNSDALEIAMNM
ncbi:hypothetical protein C3B55_00635 [Candidatus Pseudomonas adelgestsugas]|uniref:Integrase n=1 Tax=Candidatus Pseudomonas adelgestsugas TaxID=1302376 RepID=A0ABX5R8K3_9PSED|nr:hypothetical protein C3B55_00635 [Candidatus Pseudomonas adelgestsugas]